MDRVAGRSGSMEQKGVRCLPNPGVKSSEVLSVWGISETAALIQQPVNPPPGPVGPVDTIRAYGSSAALTKSDVSHHRLADTSRIAGSAIEIEGPETDQDNAMQIIDLDDGADRDAAQS